VRVDCDGAAGSLSEMFKRATESKDTRILVQLLVCSRFMVSKSDVISSKV
jgi:hypothetical protein